MASRFQDIPALQSFSEFEKQYELIVKFGVKALKDTYNKKAKSEGQTFKFSDQDVLDVLHQVINSRLNAAFKADYANLDKALRLEHTPRADNKPELTNRSILEQEGGKLRAQTQRLKNPPWAAKMDLAADPKIRDALNEIAAQLNNRSVDNNALTFQLNNVMKQLENRLKNDYKLRMSMRASPKRKVEDKFRPYK